MTGIVLRCTPIIATTKKMILRLLIFAFQLDDYNRRLTMKESNFKRITGMANIVYSIILYSIGVFGLAQNFTRKIMEVTNGYNSN